MGHEAQPPFATDREHSNAGDDERDRESDIPTLRKPISDLAPQAAPTPGEARDAAEAEAASSAIVDPDAAGGRRGGERSGPMTNEGGSLASAERAAGRDPERLFSVFSDGGSPSSER